MSTKSSMFYFHRPWLEIHVYYDSRDWVDCKRLDLFAFGRQWHAIRIPFTRQY